MEYSKMIKCTLLVFFLNISLSTSANTKVEEALIKEIYLSNIYTKLSAMEVPNVFECGGLDNIFLYNSGEIVISYVFIDHCYSSEQTDLELASKQLGVNIGIIPRDTNVGSVGILSSLKYSFSQDGENIFQDVRKEFEGQYRLLVSYITSSGIEYFFVDNLGSISYHKNSRFLNYQQLKSKLKKVN